MWTSFRASCIYRLRYRKQPRIHRLLQPTSGHPSPSALNDPSDPARIDGEEKRDAISLESGHDEDKMMSYCIMTMDSRMPRFVHSTPTTHSLYVQNRTGGLQASGNGPWLDNWVVYVPLQSNPQSAFSPSYFCKGHVCFLSNS